MKIKFIILLVALFFAPFPPSIEARRHPSQVGVTYSYEFSGTVAGKNVVITLHTKDDEKFSGFYYYKGNSKRKILLSGHKISGELPGAVHVILHEKTAAGAKGGTWQGVMSLGSQIGSFEGTYTTAHGTGFDFELY